jgi:hypothetical protein
MNRNKKVGKRKRNWMGKKEGEEKKEQRKKRGGKKKIGIWIFSLPRTDVNFCFWLRIKNDIRRYRTENKRKEKTNFNNYRIGKGSSGSAGP